MLEVSNNSEIIKELTQRGEELDYMKETVEKISTEGDVGRVALVELRQLNEELRINCQDHSKHIQRLQLAGDGVKKVQKTVRLQMNSFEARLDVVEGRLTELENRFNELAAQQQELAAQQHKNSFNIAESRSELATQKDFLDFVYKEHMKLQKKVLLGGAGCDQEARDIIQAHSSKFAAFEYGNNMSKEVVEELKGDVDTILQMLLDKGFLDESVYNEEDGSESVASIVNSVQSIGNACSKLLPEEPTWTPSKDRDDDTKPPAQPPTSASQEVVSPLGTPVLTPSANPSANPFASPRPNNLSASASERMSPLGPLHPIYPPIKDEDLLVSPRLTHPQTTPVANPSANPFASPGPNNLSASMSEPMSPLGFPDTPVPTLTPAANPSVMSSLSVASTFASPTLSSVCTAETTPESGGISVLSDITNQTN
ncbi:hypothetical protein TrST_g13999 [Triparma strigata]|uniref:Uncharacterized protein n=1 Tax=Triparma strigata TaxID=1606541 RepID=A0A9W7ECZ6_9STRA|nr:hypothetical protein TrST_g13999 [Triparma strigata]